MPVNRLTLQDSWVRETLEDSCDRVTDGSHFSPPPQKIGSPIVNVKDLRPAFVDIDSCTKVKESDFRRLYQNDCDIIKNDVLFSKDGTIGKVVVYTQDDELVALSSIAILRPSNNLDPFFLGYVMQSDDISKQIEMYSSGSALRRLVLREIKRLKISYPSQIVKQRTISQSLGILDNYIYKTTSLIEKLQNVKIGLLHDLLKNGIGRTGQIRDPLKQPRDFDIVEKYGLKPVIWKIQKIDEIKANSANALAMGPFGSNITVNNFVPSGIPVIRGVNLASFNLDFTDAVFIKEQKAEELKASNIFWNDIVITHRGTVGQVSLFKENSPFTRAVVSQSQLKVTCDKNKMLPEFLTIFLKSEFGQRLINNAKAHTGVQAIGQPLATIREMRIPVPPIPEQQRIIANIFSIDDLITSEEMNRNKLICIKQGLMQDLLTGRIPVPENLLTA